MMEVDALYSETMRDVHSLEADDSSEPLPAGVVTGAMEVDAIYKETMWDVVALEAGSLPAGAMHVDALYSETMRDTAALEADRSCSSESLLTVSIEADDSSESLPAGAMDVGVLYSEAMRDVVALKAAGSSESSSPGWVSTVAVLQIDNNWIRCSVCSQNLLYIKCPVFQCKSGHLACVLCCAEPCKNCNDGGAKFVAQNKVAEHVILYARFMCPHRGCHGFFTYSEVTAHNDACPQAPCSCALPGCGFAGPPHALLRHLTSLHSWPSYGARYGKVLSLLVSASGPCRRLILAVNDGRVFALVVDKQRGETAVSLVCVRAGVLPWPSYKARLRACFLRQSSVVAGSTSTVAMRMVTSSSRPGEVVLEKLPCVLTVPQTYYQNTGVEGSEDMFLKIGIVIFPVDN